MKKDNNSKYFILVLFIMILSLAVGYALFAEALSISGTAQTTGSFDVEFSATAVTYESSGASATSVIAGDSNSLTITVDLEQPGDNATISVTVENVGNLNANLLSVDLLGTDDTDLVVTLPTWPTGVSLTPAETYQFDIIVEWDSGSIVTDKNVNFTVN